MDRLLGLGRARVFLGVLLRVVGFRLVRRWWWRGDLVDVVLVGFREAIIEVEGRKGAVARERAAGTAVLLGDGGEGVLDETRLNGERDALR